jgi:hypothetical protein
VTSLTQKAMWCSSEAPPGEESNPKPNDVDATGGSRPTQLGHRLLRLWHATSTDSYHDGNGGHAAAAKYCWR